MDWSQSPAQLVGLPEDVLHAILHYLYSESLPRRMSEETAKACVKAVRKLPGFSKFVQLCEQFLKNTALRQREYNLLIDRNMIKYTYICFIKGYQRHKALLIIPDCLKY